MLAVAVLPRCRPRVWGVVLPQVARHEISCPAPQVHPPGARRLSASSKMRLLEGLSRLGSIARRKQDMTVISVIIGSTREGRFSEKPARWIFQQLKNRSGIDARLLDLRDFPMPFFDQPAPPAMPGRVPYEHDVVKRWTAERQLPRRMASSLSRLSKTMGLPQYLRTHSTGSIRSGTARRWLS
jgi:NADPH-dependent FMN reductase